MSSVPDEVMHRAAWHCAKLPDVKQEGQNPPIDPTRIVWVSKDGEYSRSIGWSAARVRCAGPDRDYHWRKCHTENYWAWVHVNETCKLDAAVANLRASRAWHKARVAELEQQKRTIESQIVLANSAQINVIRAAIDYANLLAAPHGWECFLYSNDGTVMWREQGRAPMFGVQPLQGFWLWDLPNGATSPRAPFTSAAEALADMIEELQRRNAP